MASVTSTGAWKLSDTYVYKLDVKLARSLLPYFENKTLVDLGAGKGRYVNFFHSHGIDVHGLEGSKDIEFVRETPLVKYADFTMKLNPCIKYDRALFLEVGEHIPLKFENNVFYNINCSTRESVIISWARPGQYGNGHVNCRSQGYVHARMKDYGFTYDKKVSFFLRKKSTFSWFKNNIMVFKRF